ncbi:peptidoglycan-binding protein [bacterium]|nr:peptidoglycan-binding protein [bacterium]
MFKIISSVFVVLFLSGCATGSKNRQEPQQFRYEVPQKTYQQNTPSPRSYDYEVKETSVKCQKPQSSSVKKICPAPVVRLSAKQIQRALKKSGFYQGSIDGKIGPKTKKAIIKFQKSKGLKADGVVGKKTTAELKKHLS